MNRTDLINSVHEKLGGKVSKTVIDAVIQSEEKSKLEALGRGEKVQLIGFGTYETRGRAARKGRNPQTGDVIDIAASTTVAFKPGKKTKHAVN